MAVFGVVMNEFSPCVLIPTRNHYQSLDSILDYLLHLHIQIVVVDDGSDAIPAAQIARICSARKVSLLRHEINAGKGFAIARGLSWAIEHGFSHVLQIDADGQHDLTRTSAFLTMAQENPTALVCGESRFDATIPTARKTGRLLTRFWVNINTLSRHITESMCGFRVYPAAQSLAVIKDERPGIGMEFDTEIVVRLHWRGIPVIMMPVNVTYPEGNLSNFDLWRDNLAISAMHAKLFLGMLVRLPRLVRQRGRRSSVEAAAEDRTEEASHWASLGERGVYAGLWLLTTIYKIFGRRTCLVAMAPVVLFFYLTGGEQRRASRDYLDRAWRAGVIAEPSSNLAALRHFFSFATSSLDSLASWMGNIPDSRIKGIDDGLAVEAKYPSRGVLLLTAHLGNPEVVKAIGSLMGRRRINVLVHTAHAERFNRLIESFSSDAPVRLFQVTRLGPDTAILLQEAIARGEWVVMAADRVPVGRSTRISWAPFLGDLAPFPQGPYILGALLKCPIYLLFCLREGAGHRIYFEPFTECLEMPRKDRAAILDATVARYAARLEAYLRLAPLQWFNFFDYWRPAGLTPPEVSNYHVALKKWEETS